MNIVITAGGTSEYIDKVRKITNSGTGKLGAIIANILIENQNIENIFYICTEKAILPTENKKIKIIKTINTESVKNAVENVLIKNKIDWFIHSMAISDYSVDYITNFKILEKELQNSTDISSTLKNPIKTLDNNKKLSSDEDNLVVVLKKTPKIIGLIKDISPKTKLIGFKLLENVEKEYLFEIALRLLNKNKCNYVIANDLKDIKEGNHKAFLINNDINIELNGKEEIAKQIDKIIRKA